MRRRVMAKTEKFTPYRRLALEKGVDHTVEWGEKVPEIVQAAGLYPRPNGN